ncbi:DUF3073 family protein [Actinomadura sp. SCN-SB]|uniref:DUF3073 family protein n=1 Tax=Actinomadura sp. SCN-SB TaxID=3373092 RepID=UPI003752075A
MGRGRAKAKQTKVARKLKYAGGHTDLDRLRRELGVDSTPGDPVEDVSRDDEGEDRYGDERYEAEYVPADRAGRDRDEESGA